ncbi:MAG: hypothetical protein ACSLE9_10935 [Burkholderiaceae bacterium]|jgi:hypothetical protein
MSENYGIESPGAHHHTRHQPPARYLIVIDGAGGRVARLFLATREPVAEFDASAEEVAVMLKGLAPARDADTADWDHALQGHSAAERRAAEVYTLDL